MGICSCTSKYILFFFNLVCALAGLLVLSVGVYSYLDGRHIREALDGQVTLTAAGMMVVGSAIFLIAFFGCCGAIREDPCCLTTYGIILSVLLVLQIAIGVVAFVYHGKMEESVRRGLQKQYEDYQDHHKSAMETIDLLQSSLHCCGPDDPSFFANNFPMSCCPKPENSGPGERCTYDHIYREGCSPKTIELVKGILKLCGIIAVSIAVIEILGVVFAFCLASSIRRSEFRGYA